MARVPLIFTVNGAEQAEFVEAARCSLDVLRDKLGLTATKSGCDQGTCGACTVLVDGEPRLSCLTLGAARARARRSRRWGPRHGGELHPLQRAFADGFAAQCGFCTPGMIMAAKALLDRNPSPTPRRRGRRDLRQHLPLHRLRADHRRGPRRRRAPSCGAATHGLRETSRWSTSAKEYLRRRARRTICKAGRHRPAALRHARPRHRPHPVLRRPQLSRHAAPQDGAQPAPPRPHPLRRHVAKRRSMPGVVRVLTHKDVPQNVYTILMPDPGRAGRRAGARRRQGALEGRADRRGARRQRARRARGGGQGEGRLRGAAGRLRHGGGAEAGRAAGQRVPRPELLHLRRAITAGGSAIGDVEKGFAEADHILEETLPVLADRACADRDDRLHRRARRRTAASPATPTRRRCSSRSTTPRSSCNAPFHKLRLVGGTVGGGFGGKVDVIVEPIAILAAMLTGRPVKYRLQPRGGDAGFLAARGRAHLHQGRRDEGRAHRRPQGHRSTSMPAPIRATPLRHHEGARRTMPGPYTIPNVQVDATASTPTARRPRRCAASASPSPTSRWRCRWTSWRG